MGVIHCSDADIDFMYDNWALCFEGMAEHPENMKGCAHWLKMHGCEMLKPDFYFITGKQMNEKYGLTGTNAYQDDFHICCIKQQDLSNPPAIYLPRFEVGGRWFTDVVDNNARRENAKF